MLKLKLELDSDISFFLDQVSPVLGREPEIHSFLLSLAAMKRDARDSRDPAASQATTLARGLGSDGSLAVAAMQTDPDRFLILSRTTAGTAEALAGRLLDHGVSLPGVNGPIPGVDAFAAAWCSRTGQRARIITHFRLFEATRVLPPPRPDGDWRLAAPTDEDLIVDWSLRFVREAVPEDPVGSEEKRRASVRSGIAAGQYWLWESGGAPVCMVGSRRETAREKWIAPVYTPPELRGRGHATALVAVATQAILDSGKKAMLFTDLANPVSNSIYPKVGYRPLADFKSVGFEK